MELPRAVLCEVRHSLDVGGLVIHDLVRAPGLPAVRRPGHVDVHRSTAAVGPDIVQRAARGPVDDQLGHRVVPSGTLRRALDIIHAHGRRPRLAMISRASEEDVRRSEVPPSQVHDAAGRGLDDATEDGCFVVRKVDGCPVGAAIVAPGDHEAVSFVPRGINPAGGIHRDRVFVGEATTPLHEVGRTRPRCPVGGVRNVQPRRRTIVLQVGIVNDVVQSEGHPRIRVVTILVWMGLVHQDVRRPSRSVIGGI